MKWFRIVLLTISALFEFLKSYTEANRVTFYYVNKCFTYTKIGVFVPTRCLRVSNIPCYYESFIDLGTTATQATLIAAGASPSSNHRCYD